MSLDKRVVSTPSSWQYTGLTSNTAYTVTIQAFVTEKDGTIKFVGRKETLHCVTNNGGEKFTNPKSVKLSPSDKEIKLKKGKKQTVTVSVVGEKKGKKLYSYEGESLFTCFSTNTKVANAVVNGNEVTIEAVGKGSCTIYFVASNGVYKTIKVKVTGKTK